MNLVSEIPFEDRMPLKSLVEMLVNTLAAYPDAEIEINMRIDIEGAYAQRLEVWE